MGKSGEIPDLNNPFCPSPLFHSQSVKEGQEFLLKAPVKTLRVYAPSSQPFYDPHNQEAPTGNAPMGVNPFEAVTRFPQVGGNRVVEAPEVVFDRTQGDEVVETPPPNDSLKASLSPPVGGLRSFRRNWQTNKCSNNMLNILTNGYVLSFITNPN